MFNDTSNLPTLKDIEKTFSGIPNCLPSRSLWHKWRYMVRENRDYKGALKTGHWNIHVFKCYL